MFDGQALVKQNLEHAPRKTKRTSACRRRRRPIATLSFSFSRRVVITCQICVGEPVRGARAQVYVHVPDTNCNYCGGGGGVLPGEYILSTSSKRNYLCHRHASTNQKPLPPTGGLKGFALAYVYTHVAKCSPSILCVTCCARAHSL